VLREWAGPALRANETQTERGAARAFHLFLPAFGGGLMPLLHPAQQEASSHCHAYVESPDMGDTHI